MIALRGLKVRGFRAYMDDAQFTFDTPMILLFGENHRGKSSTLNAIEWCLFGKECVGARTGIRERIDWEIPNRNMQPLEALVEVELEEDRTGDRFIVSRQWISARKDQLEVTLPNGQLLRGQEAKEKLAAFLSSSFRDFLTTVYQHQEAIRAVLTQEPRERNDAIDRLLGLSEYRNILTAIDLARVPAKQRKMGDDFDQFAEQVDIALRTRESDLKDKKESAKEKGIRESQLSAEGALEIAGEVSDHLVEFASEVGLPPVDLPVPELWTELEQFEEMASEEIGRLRSEMPDVKRQQELYERRSEIARLRASYDKAYKALQESSNELRDFVKKNGSEESIRRSRAALQTQIKEKEKELRAANARAAAVASAIECLKQEEDRADTCPVCGKKTANLLARLEREWKEKFEKELGDIKKDIEDLQSALTSVEALLEECMNLRATVENVKAELEEIKGEIGEALGREITPKDDPSVILGKELERIEEALQKLEEAVKSRQKTLDAIASGLAQVQVIVDILKLEEKKRIVEQIRESPEYQQMEGLTDQMAVLAGDLDSIKEAIGEASHEEAKQKVTAAAKMMDSYFRRIANNPSVSRIEFLVGVDSKTGRNSYEFKDQNGRDLTPVLSHGDLNAMALSIFLGMASLEEATQRFGFVMLDDPSQSFGSQHKEALVDVLDEVLDVRTVLLSSMDKELQGLVLARITKAKTKYVFSDWSPERGPEVMKEQSL